MQDLEARITHVNAPTIGAAVQMHSALVSELSKSLEPSLSGTWHVDETVVSVDGQLKWFWDIIDERTRYIVATHLSGNRSIAQVKALFKKSLEAAKVRPVRITSDGLQSYREGLRKVFYRRKREDRVEYIRSPGLRGRPNNNLIERFHGTLKDRTKVMRGLKAEYSGANILDGFVAHYNLLRGHLALGGMTPAQAANLDLPLDGGWADLVRVATWNRTGREA